MSEQERHDAWTAEAEHVRLRPGLVSLPLDDELVVFSEEAQCLVGLNASAALVFRKLQEGIPASELAQVIVSEGFAPPEEAGRWVATTLDALRSHGMLADSPPPMIWSQGALDPDQSLAARQIANMPAYAPFTPLTERRYRLLETCALIRFAHLAQVRAVDAVIGHLTADDCSVPNIVMDIQRVKMDDGHNRNDVYRDRNPIGCAPRVDMLGPLVKSALWQSAINAHDFLFYIHAGVVGTGESCILLPAAAGSGKSSLTAALVHSGFRYFSDEVALIERTTFEVPPMPLAICIKSTGWEVMARYYPEISSLRAHGREDGKVVRYIPPPANAAQQRPAPVSHIIFPRHVKDAMTKIQPCVRSEALGRLMGECLALRHRLDLSNVAELVGWIAGIDCYKLTFSSLDEAVELVKRIVNSGGP